MLMGRTAHESMYDKYINAEVDPGVNMHTKFTNNGNDLDYLTSLLLQQKKNNTFQ